MVLFRNPKGRKVLAKVILDPLPNNPHSMVLVDSFGNVEAVYKTQIIK